jgi:sigma-B regulation protein RsbU (phosphoserine phosphatase)
MPQAQAIPQATLEIVQTDGSRETVTINASPFQIGRGAEEGNHLVLADKRVSRRSAAIVYLDGEFHVEDRGQRQGIFVNGERVESRVLSNGDAITLGAADSVQLVFGSGAARPDTLPDLLSRFEGAASLSGGTRDLRQLSLLLEATALLQSRLPVREVLGSMVDRAIEITDADRGLLLEAGPGGALKPLLARQQGAVSLALESISPSQTAINHALERQAGVVEEDLSQAAESLRGAMSVVLQQLRTVVAIPLFSLTQLSAGEMSAVATRQLLGVLYLDSRRAAAFSHLQRQILDALATEAASVLDNAHLVERERQRRRMEQELAIAREIQQALLPKSLKDFPHFRVTGYNRPCLEVGGDYFDVMDLGQERGAFLIADVCGKGLGAALLTTMLQGAFSAMSLGQAPAPVFNHINRFICTHSEMRRYATMFFATLDPTGRLEYINAGHLPPLLIRDGRATVACEEGGLPVGLMDAAEFRTEAAQLQPGDTLVLVTDGITEAIDPQREMFGNERLRLAAERYAGESVEQLQAGIIDAVEEFSRGAYQADDITLLVIRYRPN